MNYACMPHGLKKNPTINLQVVHCICRAKIVAIQDRNGWYYSCCPTCHRALGNLDEIFYCLACDEETLSLARR